MSPVEGAVILLAGVAAGTINTVVGSGTLLTFPLLVAFGHSPVTANVTSTVGLAPGSFSGALGYRRELRGQWPRVRTLLIAAVLGSISGAILLLTLPPEAFDAIVPAFIAVAVALVIAQPRLARWSRADHSRRGHAYLDRIGVYGSGVYGGYFGAAQGILLLAVLGLTTPDDLHRINAIKNVLAGSINLVAGAIFVVAAAVAWLPALLLACGSVIGGQVGAHTARRLRAETLRVVIVIVGIVALVYLTVG